MQITEGEDTRGGAASLVLGHPLLHTVEVELDSRTPHPAATRPSALRPNSRSSACRFRSPGRARSPSASALFVRCPGRLSAEPPGRTASHRTTYHGPSMMPVSPPNEKTGSRADVARATRADRRRRSRLRPRRTGGCAARRRGRRGRGAPDASPIRRALPCGGRGSCPLRGSSTSDGR
jgi:hypothetical protein